MAKAVVLKETKKEVSDKKIKSELAVCIDARINSCQNNARKIADLTFQCVTALAEADNARSELSGKGALARFVGSITGSNARLQNEINHKQSLAQYALLETMKRMREQNLMTLDLIYAVNNKINGLQAYLGRFGTCLENLADDFYDTKYQYGKILVNHERRLQSNERNIELNSWCTTIEFQNYEGKEYKELDKGEVLACLARDFYDLTKSTGPTEQDVATLKKAISNLKIDPDELVSY